MARPLWFPRAPPGPLSCVPLWGARASLLLFLPQHVVVLPHSLRTPPGAPKRPSTAPSCARGARGNALGTPRPMRPRAAPRAVCARASRRRDDGGLESATFGARLRGSPQPRGRTPRAPRLIDWSSWPGGGCGVRFGLAPAGDNPGSELPPPPAHLLCRWAAELPSHRRGEARSSSEKIEGHRPLPHSSPPTLARGWHHILFVGTHGELIRTRNLPFPKPRL